MRSENGNDFYFAQDLERLPGIDPGGAHAPESATERTFQCRLLGVQFGGTPSPLYFATDYVSMKKWWQIGFVVSVVNLLIWTTVGFGWWKLIGLW